MSDTLKGFGPQNRVLYLEHIRNGMMRGAAAEAMGLDRRKVREWIATHPDFDSDVEDAETDATEHVYEALYQAAINGSVSAARTWIEIKQGPSQEVSHPAVPAARPVRSDASFADLDNVSPLDHARRNRDR